jgi:hypothetical protein
VPSNWLSGYVVVCFVQVVAGSGPQFRLSAQEAKVPLERNFEFSAASPGGRRGMRAFQQRTLLDVLIIGSMQHAGVAAADAHLPVLFTARQCAAAVTGLQFCGLGTCGLLTCLFPASSVHRPAGTCSVLMLHQLRGCHHTELAASALLTFLLLLLPLPLPLQVSKQAHCSLV